MSGGLLIPPGPVRVLVATKPVDFRKGMNGLAALVQEQLKADPFSGTIYCFRSKRADRVKKLMLPETFRIGSPLSPLCKPDQMKVEINSPGFSLYLTSAIETLSFAGRGSLNGVARPHNFAACATVHFRPNPL
jgi:IS66 Orf2 like protein